MDPTPDQPQGAESIDPGTRRLARQLDEYVETPYRSLKVPKHIRVLLSERLNRLTGTLDEHQAVVNVMVPLPALRQLLLDGLVTGYTLSRLEQRFFLEQNLEPAPDDAEPDAPEPGNERDADA